MRLHLAQREREPLTMTKLSTRSSRVIEAIRELRDFDTYGALRGTTSIPYPARRLQGIALTEYAEAVDKQLIDYVVLSCSTPIAWHVPGTAKGREVWS